MWHVLAGFVLSLTGMQQSTAAISPQGNDQVGNSGNIAQPGPYTGKNHEVAFEGRGRVKTKTAIGAQPDGSVYSFVTSEEQLAQNGQKIPSKNKSILYMQTPQRKNVRGRMLESQPARGTKSGYIGHKPAARKSHLIEGKPAQGKGKSIIGSPRQGVQPGKGQMLESSPGKSRAIIGGPQSRLESDDLLVLTDEQKEQLIFGSRDYLWDLNDDGLLERHLPDGIRVVIREQGMVEMFDAENRSMGQFHSPAARKMDRALRITQDMRQMVREDEQDMA